MTPDKKDQQKRFFRESLEVYFRITGRFLEDFKAHEDLFVQYFKDRIEKFGTEDLSSEEMYKLSFKYFLNFNLLNYLACVQRASSVLCSEQIIKIVSEVCDEIGTDLAFFVKAQCEMWFNKHVPVDDLVKRSRDMKAFSKMLLHVLIVRYSEMHDIAVKDKQRIASALDMKVNQLTKQ